MLNCILLTRPPEQSIIAASKVNPRQEPIKRARGSVDGFEPGLVRHVPLWKTIADTLRSAIVRGELASGVHLEELALAQKFGVSRLPVHEALARLAHEGLVRIEPHRGVFVIGLTEDDLGHIYECRRVIEGYAVRRAAALVDPNGLALLHALADQMITAVRRNQLHLVAPPDVEFHRQIVVHAGNPRLVAAWQPIAAMVGTILGIADSIYTDMEQAVNRHKDMVDALARRDPDTAESLLRVHLDRGEAAMRAALHGFNGVSRPD
jgi:DNA-binding GntR family transcriptional regulator